jgi:hypothetical protein
VAPPPAENAPPARFVHVAHWTGSETIICGGSSRAWKTPIESAARFNSATGRWTAIAGSPKGTLLGMSVWTGTELMVFGGWSASQRSFSNAGARYDLAADTWTPLPLQPAPSPRSQGSRSVVWTGAGMLFFGGWSGEFCSDTWIYYPPDTSVPPNSPGPLAQQRN